MAKRVLGMSPQAAYAMEKAHLLPLPACIPPVTEIHYRGVDRYGFVHRQAGPGIGLLRQALVNGYRARFSTLPVIASRRDYMLRLADSLRVVASLSGFPHEGIVAAAYPL